MDEKKYMERAIELAQKGWGYTCSNPIVGAVIVKNDRIIGEGYHKCYGGLHAERNAINSVSENPEGSTMYVTLEPCCHYGKTPPCTEAIIYSKISRVVIGSRDPNPLVSGKGVQVLRNAGIEVVEDFMREKCDCLNTAFFHYVITGKPYVISKFAMTIDGKIATYTGASKWITGDEARNRVHRDRGTFAAILIGINTLLSDDPLLTCRIKGGHSPIRIICDTSLRTLLTSRIVATAEEFRTIIATCSRDSDKTKALEAAGCEVILIEKNEQGKVDLNHLINVLGEKGISSVIIEGGSELHWAAFDAGIVNKVQAYIAPKIFGGKSAKSPIGGLGVSLPSQAVALDEKTRKVSILGNDILLEYEVKKCLQE